MSRKSCCSVAALISLLATAFLSGCGSDTKEGTTAPFARVAEAECAQCHGQTVDSVTAQPIYAGWQESSHFLLAKSPTDPNAAPDQTVRADCQRCHGGGNEHRGIGPLQFPNPDQAGICLQCHNSATLATLAPAHFTATTVTFTDPAGAVNSTATYVDSQTQCTFCHDPHDSKLTARFPGMDRDPDTGMVAIYADWADSGHGDTQAAPWASEDFGAPAQGACARCHSASGYKLYLQNPQAGSWAWKVGAAANDPNKEVNRCDACHANFAFVRRNGATNGAGAAKLPYTPPAGALVNNLLTNAGDSNICVNCHTGRASGTGIKTQFANLSSAAPNSHYMASAGILYNIVGFEQYTTPYSHTTYSSRGFQHDQIGLDTSFVDGNGNSLGADRGPCSVCHYTDITSGARFSHSLDPFEGTLGLNGSVTGAVSVVCGTCHAAGTSNQLGAAEINALKAQYKAGIDAITSLLLTRYGIVYDGGGVYPYFFTDFAKTHSNIRWDTKALAGGDTRPPDSAGRRLAGTAFNLNLLFREPGAYAHNQQYAMTLIFDAIDYLEDGEINGTLSGSTAVSLATLQGIFSVTVDGVTPVTARPIPRE